MPTAEGLLFAERARRILDEYDSAMAQARSEAYHGELVIGMTPGGIGELTAPLLRHVRRAMPQVSLSVYSFDLVDWPRSPRTGPTCCWCGSLLPRTWCA